MEDKKKVGLIATIATGLMCGCPGLCIVLFGFTSVLGGGTYELGASGGAVSTSVGIGLLCVGLLMLLLPLGAGGYTFYISRAKLAHEDIDEPVPPAI